MKIKNIAVIGAGIMGHGIAQVCAQAGYKTSTTDKNVEVLQQSINRIKSNLQMLVEKEIITKDEADTSLSRIDDKTSIAEAVADADFVIESVVEDMDVKKSVFEELDRSSPKHAILTTNTSSFSITEIAQTTERQEKIAGMHWWNPPYLMPLVEIVKTDQTSDETVNVTRDLAKSLGKVPAVCKDSPGFLGVRLQAALVMEAISMLEQGVASAEDIDKAVKMSLGFRTPILGPLETVDLGGMDTFYNAYDYLYRKLGNKYKPPDLLRRKAESGDLGIKTGKGFYNYTDKSIDSVTKRRAEWLMEQLKKSRGRKHE